MATEAYHLIRPPRPTMMFQYLHGIAWSDVVDKPTFRELWPQLEAFIQDAEFLVAHNAAFDRGVLNACCESYGLPAPQIPFLCTVKLARQVWDVRPTKLPDVCSHLSIRLAHHHAASDALACAKIVMQATDSGADLTSALLGARRSISRKTNRNSPRPLPPIVPEILTMATAPYRHQGESADIGDARERSSPPLFGIVSAGLALLWLLSLLL